MLSATVVITTKNRKEDLCKSIYSALSQTVLPQVLVMDDGSTDGTFELLRREFPQIQINRSDHSRGLIVQRNRAARLVETPILVSIDDDAVFSTPNVIEATLGEFDHPRVGAVAIPFVNVNYGPAVHQRAPRPKGVYATYCFIGTAHALRRDLFQNLGGYREILIHQGEEEDYCTRMLNAGYVTRCGTADPIHHFESPRRSWKRMDYFGARNKVLYAWHNVPFPPLLLHLTATTIMTSIFSLRPDRLLTRLCGVTGAYATILAGRTNRQPVTRKSYQLSRDLKLRGPRLLDEIDGKLPAMHPPNSWITCECQH